MIEFQSVSKKFGDNTLVLDNLNFSINKGGFAFLVGPTGSGKTTIFRLIIRDLLPSSGNIIFNEWNLINLPKKKIPHLRRKVGVIFQDLKLLMDRTVLENVLIPLDFMGINEKQAKDKAIEILMDVGLQDKQDKFPLQLSGGERQRVAIARALVFEPEMVLADEPTGNLDNETSIQIIELLDSINKKRGTTMFVATHNDKIIDKLNHRVIVLQQGKIIEERNIKEKSEKKPANAEKNVPVITKSNQETKGKTEQSSVKQEKKEEK